VYFLSLDNLSSEIIPPTLKDSCITFLGFPSSEFNAFLFVNDPFKGFFLDREQRHQIYSTVFAFLLGF